MNQPWLRPVPGGTELRILVQPRASRDQLVGIQGEELKIRLAAPPVDGAANAACCAFFAKLCKLPKSRVTLVAGESSRHKRLLLADVDVATVLVTLGPVSGLTSGD
ncbi:MAG: DUF167 family protein [Desulfuromonadales bacterium]|nr:DUF167 family protein [Desulfuromonadales bacterium]